MRVGVFLGEFKPDIGGGYTFVNDVAEAFLAVAGESHHQFSLFCPPDAAALLNARGLAPNVRAVPLAPRGKIERVISALKHISPAFSIAAWRWPSALERAAKREGVQMMWFVGGFFDTLDIPYIANVWDLQHLTHPWFPEVSAGGRWEYRELFLQRHLRRAAHVITGTEVGKKELMSFYRLPEDRIAILPHPTPLFALEAKPSDTGKTIRKFGLSKGFLLYPAQLWAHKNHVAILQALALLRKEGAPVPDVAFVGSDKGNKSYVLEMAAALGVSDKVHCLGFVSTEDLVALYQAAGAVVYASFSGPENLPPLEAFAFKTPLLASDFPGAREQLGELTLYFNPHEPSSLADGMKTVLQDDAQKTERLQKAHARAHQWTGKHYAQAVLTIIDEFEHERSCWK